MLQSGGGIRRNGFSDRVRSARFGDTAVEGDDGVDCAVHADVDVAVDHSDEERGSEQQHGARAPSGEGCGSGCAETGCSGAGPGEEVESRSAAFPGFAEVAELADALA